MNNGGGDKSQSGFPLDIFRSDFMSAYNACSHNHSDYTPNTTGCFTWPNKSCKVHVEMAVWHTVLPSAGTKVQMFPKYGWLRDV